MSVPEESHAQFASAFLLTQLGTAAAAKFGARVAELDLTPPMVGTLRMISVDPGLSQQALAERLGMLPSKVVQFVDTLEQRGLVTRARSTRDRRVYQLSLTNQGKQLMHKIRAIAAEHDNDFCSALDAKEREQLGSLLRRLAESHQLTPGVHPGYRHIR